MNPAFLTRELADGLPPRDREMARAILKKGLLATFNGHAWRVTGTGICLCVTSLRYIARSELSPVSMERRW